MLAAKTIMLLTCIYTKEAQTHIHYMGELVALIEAHKCGVGVLTREALVPIGSGPNNTPPLRRVDGIPGTRQKKE